MNTLVNGFVLWCVRAVIMGLVAKKREPVDDLIDGLVWMRRTDDRSAERPMVRHVQTRAGHIGYRDQLDRARRFLERMEQSVDDMDDEGMTDVDFQDMVWAFFQNCWHVKDWVDHDPVVSLVTKQAVLAQAYRSVVLNVCQDMCNGTKHLGARQGASHDHVDTTIVPGGPIIRDCLIDSGAGQLVSGRMLARQCIAEWVSILQSQGLETARRS
jgi:hypothetical protein